MRSLRITTTHCDRTLLALLQTFFDILLIRKGPEDLPASRFLMWLAIGASVALSLITAAALLPPEDVRVDVTLALATFAGVLYMSIVVVAGHRNRLTQFLTATFGTDALFTAIYLVGYLVLLAIAGETTAKEVMGLFFYWSIVVQGHIIARTIGGHWLVGIVIAIVVFILLLLMMWQMTAPQQAGV
jgi:hypothetical protein